MQRKLKMTPKKVQKSKKRTTVNAAEIRQFDSLGAQWWDESGPMRPLHRLNPTRMDYLRTIICQHLHRPTERLRALQGVTVADIGCGGGLVAEPLCRMGAQVTGIDAGAENIRIAKAHAKTHGLDIDYRATTAEALANSGATFDVVTALEIVEHVSDTDLFLQACCRLVRPGGVLVLSTLNRTPKSFMLGIVAAEYVLRWLPPGTHDWKNFKKPSELAKPLQDHDLRVVDITGLVYRPLSRDFTLSKTDLGVNYFLTAIRED